jgi:hypothetical protein
LSGGLSNVIRQYLGEGRVSLICAIFAFSSARTSSKEHNRNDVLWRQRPKAISQAATAPTQRRGALLIQTILALFSPR